MTLKDDKKVELVRFLRNLTNKGKIPWRHFTDDDKEGYPVKWGSYVFEYIPNILNVYDNEDNFLFDVMLDGYVFEDNSIFVRTVKEIAQEAFLADVNACIEDLAFEVER